MVDAGGDALERIGRLRAEIERHDDLYYRQARPEISDAAYDALVQELRALEAAFPEEAALALSLAEGHGEAGFNELSGHFAEFAHREPMGSLLKIRDEAGVERFLDKLRDVVGEPEALVEIEPKLDGMAISLVYEKGRLVRALTRGNGRVGEDILANLREVEGLPRLLSGSGVPEFVELRGELFSTFENFARVNAEQSAKGEALFVNPRNLASGSARLEDASKAAQRGLSLKLFGWGAWEPAESEPVDGKAFRSLLAVWGLPVLETLGSARTLEECQKLVEAFRQGRDILPYPTDGLVLKAASTRIRKILGVGEEGPHWAVAYKFAGNSATTRLERVVYTVGRTGEITPVAEFGAVELNGAIIRRASLHNRAVLEELDLHEGDTLVVELAGDIIPQVKDVLEGLRVADASRLLFPVNCPSCGHPLVFEEAKVSVRCTFADCPEKNLRALQYFLSAEGLNVRGIGPETVEKLFLAGLVKEPADFFRLSAGVSELTESQIAGLKDASVRSAEQVYRGLGIPGIGATGARRLAKVFPELSALADWDGAEARPGLGGRLERLLKNFLEIPENRQKLLNLAEVISDVRVGGNLVIKSQGEMPLKGKVFALTGRLPTLTREAATALIEEAGGEVRESLGKQCDFLVAGENPGAKLDKARRWGIPVISEHELREMLGVLNR